METHEGFIRRHLGPSDLDIARMLSTLGVESLDELIEPQCRR